MSSKQTSEYRFDRIDCPVKRVPGLESLYSNYDAILIDVWGVLHDGAPAREETINALEALRRESVPVVIVSNAARRTAALARELADVGIASGLYAAIVSSGELTWQSLRRGPDFARAGATGFYLGPARSRGLGDGLEIDWSESLDSADFVLNTGAPRGNPADVESLAPLLRKIRDHELPMICANPDLCAIRHGELGISAGAIAAAYLELGGRVVSFGKPDREIFDRALASAGNVERGRALMIGDAFATDIAGAANAGIDSLLIAGGIHAAELDPLDDRTVSSLAAVYGAMPTYYCDCFRW